MEQQAHRFAGAILFPRDLFLSEVGQISLDYFSSLKKRWGLSIAAMVSRAFDLGLIDVETKATLFHGMTRRRWRGPLREPFDDQSVMPLERPRMLRRAVEVVLETGIFARSAIRAALPLPQAELESLVGGSPGFLSEGELVRLSVSADPPQRSKLSISRVVRCLNFRSRRKVENLGNAAVNRALP